MHCVRRSHTLNNQFNLIKDRNAPRSTINILLQHNQLTNYSSHVNKLPMTITNEKQLKWKFTFVESLYLLWFDNLLYGLNFNTPTFLYNNNNNNNYYYIIFLRIIYIYMYIYYFFILLFWWSLLIPSRNLYEVLTYYYMSLMSFRIRSHVNEFIVYRKPIIYLYTII